jgi:predicted  nucleic acid-binding Zn-ribbon protein
MKPIAFFLSLLISFCLSAQENIHIEAATYSGFTGAEENVFTVDVARVNKTDYMNHWEKYLKENTDFPVVRSDNDITVKGATIKKLGSRVLNIYLHFQPSSAGTVVYVGFQDTVTGFIGADHPQYGIDIKKLILEETQKVYLQTRGEDVEKEKAYLKTLEKELSSIKDEEKKIQKSIMKYEQEVDKLKNEIAINEGVMEELVFEISDRRSSVIALSSDAPKEVRKKAEKEAKSSEKKRDKLRKQIDKDKQKIFDLERDIADALYQVNVLQPGKEEATRKVEAQRDLLMEINQDVSKMKR